MANFSNLAANLSPVAPFFHNPGGDRRWNGTAPVQNNKVNLAELWALT